MSADEGDELVPGLVSVVIPVHNRAGLTREAVASVVAQTYRPVEILLVDDGSTDGTAEACDELASRMPDLVRVSHRSNGGPGAARETGRLAARGEFLQYLDSDDLLLPRKLEAQVAALRSVTGAGVAYGYTRFRKSDGSLVEGPWKGSGIERKTMFPSFLTERWWDTPTPLYRRSVTDAAGPWLPLWQEEDWEYDCRVAALGTRLVQVKEFVAEVRDHGEDRLSTGAPLDARRCRARALAHEAVYGHARQAGIGTKDSEMQHYARELFLLARQCGAAGLPEDSRRLFTLAQEASGAERAKGLDFRAYRMAASVLGWEVVGGLACRADGLRRGAAESVS